MDIGAYCNIEILEDLMLKNGIDIPRPRGLRLMEIEEHFTKENYKNAVKDAETLALKHLIESEWGTKPYLTYNDDIRRKEKYYMGNDRKEVNWTKIHGKRRKALKYKVKKYKKAIKEQYDMWNKYAGEPNILLVHSRTGGPNWKYFDCDRLRKEDWFLDKADDWFDITYCDIYVKISMSAKDREEFLGEMENE